MKNIYLVGFMGTGKTTVGRVLAGKLNFKFVDLDDLIEGKEGIKIVDIFAKKGEAYFRDLESTALKETGGKEKLVVACGGGIVIRPGNVDFLEKNGLTVCLDAEPEAVYGRIRKSEHRPLLNVSNPKKEIEKLLNARKEFYNRIKRHIDTSSLTIEETADRIAEWVEDNY